MYRCGRRQLHMPRCMNCAFARYCSTSCQAAHWKSKHKGDCYKIFGDDFDYQLMKAGLDIAYGPVSQYEFDLLRHLANEAGPKCLLCPYVDLSVPFKIVPWMSDL